MIFRGASPSVAAVLPIHPDLRLLISERTKQSIASARAKGKLLGRPQGPGKSKLDQFRPEIEALLKNGSPKTFIAKRHKTSTANLYQWMKKKGISLKSER